MYIHIHTDIHRRFMGVSLVCPLCASSLLRLRVCGSALLFATCFTLRCLCASSCLAQGPVQFGRGVCLDQAQGARVHLGRAQGPVQFACFVFGWLSVATTVRDATCAIYLYV